MAVPTIGSTSTNDVAIEYDYTVAADGWRDVADLRLDDDERPADAACRRGTGEDRSGDEPGGFKLIDYDLDLPTDFTAAAQGGDDDEAVYNVAPTRRQIPKHGWAALNLPSIHGLSKQLSATSLFNMIRQLQAF